MWLGLFILFFNAVSCANVPHYSYQYERPFLSKMFFYHPPMKTLNDIVEGLYKRQPGAYICFNTEDIKRAADENFSHPIRNIFKLTRETVFKSLPLRCKNRSSIEFIGDSEQCYQQCIQPIRYCWGSGVNQLYAYNLISHIVHGDLYQAARFFRLLKSIGCILITDSKSKNLKQILGPESVIINSDDKNMVASCYRILKKDYRIVLLNGGSKTRLLIPLLMNFNCFVIDCGSILDIPDTIYGQLNDLLQQEVKILVTSAILEDRFEERKQEYENSISILHSFLYDPYIVESCSTIPTFFDAIALHVCYAKSNIDVPNKGINEILSLRKAIEQFQFNDNDMIIKLTGRYFFKNDQFIRIVESHPSIDGFIGIDPMSHFAYSGCFALRHRYFKELITQIDLAQMAQYWIDFERVVIDYIKNIEGDGAKIMYMNELGVQAFVNHQFEYHW